MIKDKSVLYTDFVESENKMSEQFSRTELLFGNESMKRLENARVAVFGIGGVGGYTVEALVRSGVGAIDLVDSDTVAESNLNRQIIATRATIGQFKVDAMKERIMQINPKCKVTTHRCFYLPETAEQFDFGEYDYVVDAVDTVTAKIQLVMQAKESNVPIISSMGAGNKLNPAEFEVADIYKTSVCPLAKVMRRELKRRGVKKLKVVYSKEEPITPMGITSTMTENSHDTNHVYEEVSKKDLGFAVKKRVTPGSVAFVPSVVGLIIASEVVKDLVK